MVLELGLHYFVFMWNSIKFWDIAGLNSVQGELLVFYKSIYTELCFQEGYTNSIGKRNEGGISYDLIYIIFHLYQKDS